MRFGAENYRGTLFFHRLAVYASIILEKDLEDRHGKSVISRNGKDIHEDFDILVNSVKKIAFLNAVKCSPTGNYSQLTQNMLKICPQHFLLNEILVLKPKFILIMSKEVFDALRVIKSFSDASNLIHSFLIEEKHRLNYCGYCEMTINDQIIKGFWVFHPSRGKGASRKVASELFTLKQNINP